MLQACITCRRNCRCCTTVRRCSIYRCTPWRKRASDRCRRRTKRVFSCRPRTRPACKPPTRPVCRPRTRPACRRTRPACKPPTRPVCRPRTRPACRRTRPACRRRSWRRGRCAPCTRATRRPPPTARPRPRTLLTPRAARHEQQGSLQVHLES